MNKSALLILPLLAFLMSCGTPKSYFTVGIRKMVEDRAVPINELQFYVDRDVELRRELTSGDVKINSGKIKFENGKYVHIILLKKFTPGVCTKNITNKLEISFEMGDDKKLSFGVPNGASFDTNYQIFADNWSNNFGNIMYDGKLYQIQPEGSRALLMIKKSSISKLSVQKRVMKGRKL